MKPIKTSWKDIEAYEDLKSHKSIGNKAVLVFKHLLIQKDFQDLIGNLRGVLRIPQEGFEFGDKSIRKFLCYDERRKIGTPYKIIIDFEPVYRNAVLRYIEKINILNAIPEMNHEFVQQIIHEYLLFNRFTSKIYIGSFAKHNVFLERGEMGFLFPVTTRKEEIKQYINHIYKNHDFGASTKEKDQVKRIKKDNLFEKIIVYNCWLKHSGDLEKTRLCAMKDQVFKQKEKNRRAKKEEKEILPYGKGLKRKIERFQERLEKVNGKPVYRQYLPRDEKRRPRAQGPLEE